ncbi:hypothetical protein [Blastopirellula marina]|uniref:Uncharacterized protein n=1 Tax=Blastopirellula marina TaxID=124 RepID=A0A2S8GP16_9BACT|nr:hypothetical protein [Blastopirellula marina]PQO46101.1 hypothetical protein C5Y93_11030 [Blastopirellula marina]
MTAYPFDSKFYRSVDRKLRFGYLRWLSTHKPDYFWFHPLWRSFWRAYRRGKYAVAKWFLPQTLRKYAEICLIVLAVILFVTMVGVRAFPVVGYEMLGALANIPREVFHGIPGEWPPVAPALETPIPFGRLTIFQTSLAVLMVLAGIRAASPPDAPDRRLEHRAVRRRSQLCLLIVLFTISLLVCCAGAWNAPRDTPAFLWSMVATGIVGLAVSWFSFQVAVNLGSFRLRIAKEHKEVAGAIIFLTCVGVGLFLIVSPISIHLFRELAWLGPIGWLNDQAMQISAGNLTQAWSLGLAIALMAAAAMVLRRKSQTWQHRREVLADDPPPTSESPTVSSDAGELREALRRRVREELHPAPITLGQWICPRWLRERSRLMALMAPLVVFTQAMAIFCSFRFAQYADAAFPVGSDLQDLIRFPLLGSIPLAIMLLELGHALPRVVQTIRGFSQRPISAGELWRELQWDGLVRIPTILFWLLPCLVVPLTLLYREWWLVPATIVLSLLAWVALRTLLAAVTIVTPSLERLPEVWQLVVVVPFLIPSVSIALCFSSSLPDLGNLGPVWIRLFAAQGLTLAQFGIAYGIWRWSGGLAKEPASRAGE